MRTADQSSPRPDIFTALFEHCAVNSIIIMDEHGYILDVNQAFTTAFGYSKESIVGKHSRILFTDHDQKAQRPEMELVLVKKQGFSTDQNYTVHQNGNRIWVSGESVWVPDSEYGRCIVKVIQNIHAQKLQEKFLSEANEFSNVILASIEDGMLVINEQMVILKANEAFYRMFERSPSSVEGTSLLELEHLLNINFHVGEKFKNSSAHTLQEELEWTIPGAGARVLQLNFKLLNHQAAGEKRLLVLVRDVTGQKQAEQQREDFINFLSHELRNPMANLALILELLPGSIHDNQVHEAEEYLHKAKMNLKRLKQVIEELHDSTRAATGNLSLQKTRFNVSDLINEAADTVRLLYPHHKITCTECPDRDIHADRFRLVQVLNNYLTNAIKYSPGSDKVDLQVSLSDDTLVVAVSDRGPGIPPDQLPYVFNKYYRGQSAAKVEGLGLGLYVCKAIITAHGGKVWATSEYGRGSTFFFSIPV